MSTNIYEQAIAEAKKLREVAEQNAKNAIIEAITPRVRELIDRELTGNIEESDEFINESYESYNEDDEIILEESAILELAREISEEKDKDEDEDKESKKDAKKEDLDEDVFETIERLLNEKENEEEENSNSKKESYKNEDDMNLEELLNEIKMEIDFGEIEDDELESALLELMPTVKMLEEEEEEAGEVELEAGEGEGEAADSEEGEEREEMKFDFSELEAGEEEEEAEEPVEEVFSINEAALSRELERLRNNRSSNSTNGNQKLNESRYREQLLKEQRNNRELKGKLDEYRGAVESLRDQLNEMNLFNAKLLYVNKLLQTKGLDSSQKKTIIESIDNAESLREVKLVYKTLSESVNKKKTGSLNETKIRKLAGSSSRPTKSGGALITESSASGQVDRWARLAGLK